MNNDGVTGILRILEPSCMPR